MTLFAIVTSEAAQYHLDSEAAQYHLDIYCPLYLYQALKGTKGYHCVSC